jgi:hypothetical protein
VVGLTTAKNLTISSKKSRHNSNWKCYPMRNDGENFTNSAMPAKDDCLFFYTRACFSFLELQTHPKDSLS